MMKNHKLAGSIQDVAWYSLVSKIEYKAKWKGVNVIKIKALSHISVADFQITP